MKETEILEMVRKLNEIRDIEPDVATAIGMVVDHIYGTYSDKYSKGERMGVDTKAMLYHPVNGKPINEYQIARYLQRYITTGSKKSGLLKDMLKLIHYGIFELVRRIKIDKIDLTEPAE